MSEINMDDLNDFEQEIFDCLSYCYDCSLNTRKVIELSSVEKKNIKKKMQVDDYQLNPTYQLHQQLGMQKGDVPVTPKQLLEILNRLEDLREKFNDLAKLEIKKLYGQLLQSCVLINENIGIRNSKIKRRVTGLLAAQAKYEKKLYPRREILYRVLREQVQANGKWKNLNQAVKSILPLLMKEYLKFDLIWIEDEISAKLEKMKRLRQMHSAPKIKNEQSINRQARYYLNRLKRLETEIEELKQALYAKDPSRALGKKMPFNADYTDESIIHHLRNCPDILKEILS